MKVYVRLFPTYIRTMKAYKTAILYFILILISGNSIILMAQVPEQITHSLEYAKHLNRIENDVCEIALDNTNNTLWTFHLRQGQNTLRINAPVFEVDGRR